MVNDQIRRNDETGGVASLFVAMIELGDAATKFTINQMQSAVDIFMDPGRAIDRTRRSLNHFSDAMYRSARSDYNRHEIDTQKDLTGQRHTDRASDDDQQEPGTRRAGVRHNGTNVHRMAQEESSRSHQTEHNNKKHAATVHAEAK
jgi:hypothetical protein